VVAKLGAAINKLGAAINKLGAAIAKLGAAIDRLGAVIAKLGAESAKVGADLAKVGADLANVGAAASMYLEPSKQFRGLAEIDLEDATHRRPADRPSGVPASWVHGRVSGLRARADVVDEQGERLGVLVVDAAPEGNRRGTPPTL
jgi:hypothetical protein